jgi:hypothetical protein
MAHISRHPLCRFQATHAADCSDKKKTSYDIVGIVLVDLPFLGGAYSLLTYDLVSTIFFLSHP